MTRNPADEARELANTRFRSRLDRAASLAARGETAAAARELVEAESDLNDIAQLQQAAE